MQRVGAYIPIYRREKFSETWEIIHRIVDLFGIHKLTKTYIPDRIDLKVD